MCDKVISPFCSVAYCTFKDNCCKEHPKRDCCNSSWPKKGVIKDIGNNVNMENFVKDIKKIKSVNSGIFIIVKMLTIC